MVRTTRVIYKDGKKTKIISENGKEVSKETVKESEKFSKSTSSGSSSGYQGAVTRSLEGGGTVTVTGSGLVTERDKSGNIVTRYTADKTKTKGFVDYQSSIMKQAIQTSRMGGPVIGEEAIGQQKKAEYEARQSFERQRVLRAVDDPMGVQQELQAEGKISTISPGPSLMSTLSREERVEKFGIRWIPQNIPFTDKTIVKLPSVLDTGMKVGIEIDKIGKFYKVNEDILSQKKYDNVMYGGFNITKPTKASQQAVLFGSGLVRGSLNIVSWGAKHPIETTLITGATILTGGGALGPAIASISELGFAGYGVYGMATTYKQEKASGSSTASALGSASVWGLPASKILVKKSPLKFTEFKVEGLKTYRGLTIEGFGKGQPLIGIQGAKPKFGTPRYDFTQGRSPFIPETFTGKNIILKSLTDATQKQRVKVGFDITKGTVGVRSRYKELSFESETFSPEQVRTIFESTRKAKGQVYGSMAAQQQIEPAKRWRIAKDIDIQLQMGDVKAKQFQANLVKELNKLSGAKVRSTEGLLIEAQPKGVKDWVHGVDIHSLDMAVKDAMSPSVAGEKVYGLQLQGKSETIKGIEFMGLSEQGRRKFASIGTIRPGKKVEVLPEPHRLKDIGDFIGTQSVLIDNIIRPGKKTLLRSKVETFKTLYPEEMLKGAGKIELADFSTPTKSSTSLLTTSPYVISLGGKKLKSMSDIVRQSKSVSKAPSKSYSFEPISQPIFVSKSVSKMLKPSKTPSPSKGRSSSKSLFPSKTPSPSKSISSSISEWTSPSPSPSKSSSRSIRSSLSPSPSRYSSRWDKYWSMPPLPLKGGGGGYLKPKRFSFETPKSRYQPSILGAYLKLKTPELKKQKWLTGFEIRGL